MALALALAGGAVASAQATGAAHDLGGGSPQSTMRGFLEAARAGDWHTAARFLDLRRVRPDEREARGSELAREVKWALDRTLWVDVEALSTAPEGEQDDGLPGRLDRVGVVETDAGSIDVLVERVPGASPPWRLSAETVAALAALFDTLGGGWLADHLAAPFFDLEFLELALWQWLGLLLLVVLSSATAWLLVQACVSIVYRFAGASSLADDGYLRASRGPLLLLVGIGLFVTGTAMLALAVPVRDFIGGIARTLTIAAVAWLLARLVSAAGRRVEARLREQGRMAAIALVPLGRRTVTLVLVGITLIAALQNLGVNVTGIVAGLGVGGLAVALAAQKTVENLFGGLTLVVDQPVRVGDFCRFGEKLGTVEEIGLRSTRIRTLDRTLVSVPNAEFSSLQLESFTARDRIRFVHTIGLRYETSPDRVREVLEALRAVLRSHPRVHPDPARVRFVGFGAYSLDLEIFAYLTTSDYNEYLELAEGLLLQIAETVLANGAEFAFPSQTVYVGRDATTSPEPIRAGA
ncbi:MAG: mechanosensitive ion channel domain-containing protein [Myxococcota bacterium]